MKKTRRQSGLFKKYFAATVAVILVSFLLAGTALAIVVPGIWMNEKLDSLEETARSVTANTMNVLLSDFLGSVSRNAVMMICNNLTQVSDATDSDIFIVNETGEVVYCKDLLNPKNNGKCFIHDRYVIPAEIMQKLRNHGSYRVIGKIDGVMVSNNLIVACPLTAGSIFRGAVFVTQSVSKGLWLYISVIARMFIIAALFALILTAILSYFISYRLTKPLREMSVAVKQYSNGDFTKRITVSRKHGKLNKENEIDELADSFNSMAAALEAQEQSRRSFVSNVSHELKTPMTSIGGFIDGILDGTISGTDEKKYLKIVSEEVKRLSRLVTGMLNMSKIEAGQIDIKPEEFDISDMLFRTLLSFEKIIESKNIEIRGLEALSENKVFADKDMINQVVYNLIDNAVKFTPEGGYIEIISKSDGEKIIIKIRNSGRGIAPDEIDKIFERFYKTDKSRSFDVKGAGMGLFIVKQLIELHAGHITARSVENEYAEFIFDLPLYK